MSAQNLDTVQSSLAAQNAEVVRQGYAAFNTGDLDTLTRLFDESSSWQTPGRGILAGDQKGRDATFAQFGRYVTETAGTFRAELRYVTADDEGHVIAFHQNSGERNGKLLNVDCCIAFEVRGRPDRGRQGVLLRSPCLGRVLVLALLRAPALDGPEFLN